MRKIAITLLALGLFVVSTAFAAPLLNETFSYVNGNLVPNGSWATYSGATGDIQVASGRATGVMATSAFANDDAKAFTAQTLTNSTYACFDVVIPTFSGAAVPAYFAGLKDAGTANMVARVYVLPISGGWTFGISHGSTNTTALGVTPWGSTPLAGNTHYNIVIKYDPVAKSSTLWVNPSSEASPSVTDAVSTSTSLIVATAFLRQGAASSFPPAQGFSGTAVWGWSVDNLGVGTTFEDACYTVATPATSSTWGKLKSLYR